MRISREWLEDHVDLSGLTDEDVARRLTEIGHAVEATLSQDGATVFEVEFTSNRVDAMSHRGLARELSAALERPLRDAPPALASYSEPSVAVRISIDAPELCSRYTGLVIRGVSIGPSSERIQKRLSAVGLRPINSIVDATNYVMIDHGHPLHAFDLDRLSGPEIIVRAGRVGEKLQTLDGTVRDLTPEAIVIADASRGVALGGVMGGHESEISATTRNVLLECAMFTPSVVRRMSRTLGLRTDASYRFERGVDAHDTVSAITRCAALIVETAGGSAEPPIDVVARTSAQRTLRLRAHRLGIASAGAVGLEYASAVLGRIGMLVHPSSDGIEVVVPTFRNDIEQEDDLIEEVLRLYGFNRIPASLPRVTTGDTRHDPIRQAEEKVRDILVGAGLAEAIAYSFVHPDRNRLFSGEEPLAITNALIENIGSMRLSTLPGLLETVAFNRSYGTRDGGLFEVGRTYHRDGKGVRERSVAGLVIFGSIGDHWGDSSRPADFFDAKGIVETIAHAFHVEVELSPSDLIWAKAGQAAVVRTGELVVGEIGYVRRETLQQLEVKGDVIAAEIDLEALTASSAEWTMAPVSRFPGVPMVAALVHAPGLSYGELLREVRAIDVPFLHEVGIRDRWFPEGASEVKTTLGMWYQALDRSLTQEEVAGIHGRLVARIAEILPVTVVKA